MIIFTIFVAIAFLIGALVLYTLCTYMELKGYERGLDEAEEIMTEVYKRGSKNGR